MIFVSHKESDASLARALVEFVKSSLDVPDAKVRCTSVPGYQLPFGTTIANQLKQDIHTSSAVFVLMTPASLNSPWVLFELGAAWALGKVIVPILAHCTAVNDLPGPLKEYPVVRADDPNAAARLRDAVSQIARELDLKETGGGRAQSALESFLRTLRDWEPAIAPDVQRAKAFLCSFHLMMLFMKQAPHPRTTEAEIEGHSADLGMRLPAAWYRDVTEDSSGQRLRELVDSLAGQLSVRQPQLLPYFAAGQNVIAGASHNGVDGVKTAIARLGLPAEISRTQNDALSWVNQIHSYFHDVLSQGRS